MLTNPYLYLSLTALVAKIYCAYRLRKNWSFSAGALMCFVFLLLQYSQTVLEIYVCWAVQYASSHDMLLILRLYYALFTCSLVFIPLLVYSVAQSRFRVAFILPTALLMLFICVVSVGGDWVVRDATVLRYTMTRVAGPYYGLFQLVSFAAMAMALAVALRSYFGSKVEVVRVKSMNFFIGYLPYVIFVVTVILAMAAGLHLNAAGLSPLIMSIFVLVLSENVKLEKLRDLRVYFFWTRKARRIREVTEALRYVSQSPDHAKNMFEKYNEALLEVAAETFSYVEHGRGKQKQMAAWLGIDESKMSRMLRREKDNKK